MKIALASRPAPGDERILPVINVVFLLLIFFMLVGAMAVPEMFPVQPPRSSAAEEAGSADATLLVAADGRLALGAERIAPAELVPRLRAWQAAHPDAALQLKADARIPAVGIVDLLGRLREAGIGRVRLVIREEGGLPRPARSA